MRKYEFLFNPHKDMVTEQILSGVRKPEYITEDEVIYGKVSKDKKRLLIYHGIKHRNSFRPVFSAKIIENNEERTIISGIWRFSVFAGTFLLLCFVLLLSGMCAAIAAGQYISAIYVCVILFLAFGIMYFYGIRSERKRMERVMEYLAECQTKVNKDIDITL